MTKNQSNNFNVKFLVAIIIFAIVLLFFKYGFQSNNEDWKKGIIHKKVQQEENGYRVEQNENSRTDEKADATSHIEVEPYYPSHKGQLVKHKFYALSYVEEWEQAEWVCYKLTKQILQMPNVKRSDWFNEDPLITTGSAKHFQYKGSGYTRGHMAPAGDMSFDQTAMEESFFMSNMSPQPRALNNGIWRELEEQTRDWVYQNKELYIVSGPVFYGSPKYFKKHKIAIPDAFFKVLLDVDGPEKKGICFIIPNKLSNQPLSDFAFSIDEAESKTGINFFSQFMVNEIESLESSINIARWPISEARYNLRVSRWNNE